MNEDGKDDEPPSAGSRQTGRGAKSTLSDPQPQGLDAGRVARASCTGERFHRIYERTELARALAALVEDPGEYDGDVGVPAGPDPSLSNEETARFKALRRLANDPRGPCRRSIVASPHIVRRLAALGEELPHFVLAIEVVHRAALVSRLTSSELRVPPLLLLGPPGIGKSYALRRIAEAIGAEFSLIAMNMADGFRLRGLNSAWRGAKTGRIAEIILAADTNPVILLDEFDKAAHLDRNEGPYDLWHSLLERENAATFRDDYLEIAIRADRVIWAASVNDLTPLPASIVDRLLVIRIEPPTRAQLEGIVAGIYATCRAATGDLLPEHLDQEVVHELARHNPRRLGRILELAVGYAAAARRRHLMVDDVRRAEQLASESGQSLRFRGPIGFTRIR